MFDLAKRPRIPIAYCGGEPVIVMRYGILTFPTPRAKPLPPHRTWQEIVAGYRPMLPAPKREFVPYPCTIHVNGQDRRWCPSTQAKLNALMRHTGTLVCVDETDTHTVLTDQSGKCRYTIVKPTDETIGNRRWGDFELTIVPATPKAPPKPLDPYKNAIRALKEAARAHEGYFQHFHCLKCGHAWSATPSESYYGGKKMSCPKCKCKNRANKTLISEIMIEHAAI